MKDFSEFYLINQHQHEYIWKWTRYPNQFQQFVFCHRWYSKNINRMQAQELLMKEVKKKIRLKNFDYFLILLP